MGWPVGGCDRTIPRVQVDRIVSVAFSGDPGPGVQRRELAVVVAEPDEARLSISQGYTWGDLSRGVVPHCRPGSLIAFDFPFCFPQGFIAHELDDGVESWPRALEWAHVHGELTLALGRAPFWGRHGWSRPKTHTLPSHGLASINRQTERQYRPAKSVFQVAGPDAIGTAALRGMAWLHREQLPDRLHAWPFHGPADGSRGVLCEVLPRAFWPDMRIEDPGARRLRIQAIRERWRADDPFWETAAKPYPFKAVTAACGLAQLCAGDPELFTDPGRTPVTDLALRYEGWCLGPRGAGISGAS